MEKFCDYLLGSNFHVYMENSPLSYDRESKLGASQIQWLSALALFDFTIHYQSGRSNKAADALSRHPHTEEETKMREVETFHTHLSVRWLMNTLISPRYQMT